MPLTCKYTNTNHIATYSEFKLLPCSQGRLHLQFPLSPPGSRNQCTAPSLISQGPGLHPNAWERGGGEREEGGREGGWEEGGREGGREGGGGEGREGEGGGRREEEGGRQDSDVIKCILPTLICM